MNARVSLNSHSVERWHAARNVLAVRLDNLGDVLMTTPALAAIRHTLPKARLTLLASPGGGLVAHHVPDVDDLITFQAPWMKGGSQPGAASGTGPASIARRTDPHPGEATLAMAERLATRRFDAAVIFTVCTQSALPAAMLCLLAGIPLRLGHCRENPYDLLTHWVRDTDVIADEMRHEVTRQLDLVGEVGLRAPSERLQFHFSPAEAARMRRHMREAGLDPSRPYFVVHPGASAPSRRYPAERFGVAARLLAERCSCQVVFTGDASEIPIVEEAREAMGRSSASLAGVLTLGEFGALIEGAQVLITNNSGPAHVAAAVNTPVVDLYALTNPQHTPWKVASRVLYADVPCRNCLKSVCPESHHACLREVSPHRVAAAGMELIEQRFHVEHASAAKPTGEAWDNELNDGLPDRLSDEPSDAVINAMYSFSLPQILRLTEAR